MTINNEQIIEQIKAAFARGAASKLSAQQLDTMIGVAETGVAAGWRNVGEVLAMLKSERGSRAH